MNGKILNKDFYTQDNVIDIAQKLLGKILVTNFNKQLTAARIVETEAYNGVVDKASHAYNYRYTNRTQIMYATGGVAYVYLCYGIHHLFNVVVGKKDNPLAVLIRAAEPLAGIDIMLARTAKKKLDYSLTKGPGNVAKAMGIHTIHTGKSLLHKNEMYILDDGWHLNDKVIITTPRIGVAYAAEHALLPYRFYISNNKYVSGNKKDNFPL